MSERRTMGVTEMTEHVLQILGADGLVNGHGECGCELGDLGPCLEGINSYCEAARMVECPPEGCEECPADGECRYRFEALYLSQEDREVMKASAGSGRRCSTDQEDRS